ncbi:MAG: ADP-forming succinate--CoA ligase subunit beta [Verrucomicrobiota bacterium]|jgi:succinyl-CoA synthetase beta subunit|nr:ADP-forming succinate--CoA ligase subunit beta [Verrucomicrobiota bacterium]MDI9385379.1 ADP-forming succinate--CoA ligase subunit beta [Verrucomicrobiota bacterium]
MNIHEYQAKELLRNFQVPVPDGEPAFTPNEAASAARTLGAGRFVVKAQIHAGGRGKAGGVRFAASPQEVADITSELLGKVLVTHQTGPEGKEVGRVLVERATPPKRELYLSILLDRKTRCPMLMASAAGGMDIEEVAETSPDKIIRIPIDPAIGLLPYQARKVLSALEIPTEIWRQGTSMILGVYRAFWELDAALVEINPLILTEENTLLALDAKMNFDSNALFRHKQVAALRDLSEEDPQEIAASEHDLSYVRLEGNIGCMVNGAGLAMATMDIIKLFGGSPANFLDVGGGASTDQVREAFKILASDPNVQAIFVNIFGGIMRCDVIAEGIIQAVADTGLNLPLIVRLEGTNVEEGRKKLLQSGLPIKTGDSMSAAAQLAVQAAETA